MAQVTYARGRVVQHRHVLAGANRLEMWAKLRAAPAGKMEYIKKNNHLIKNPGGRGVRHAAADGVHELVPHEASGACPSESATGGGHGPPRQPGRARPSFETGRRRAEHGGAPWLARRARQRHILRCVTSEGFR